MAERVALNLIESDWELLEKIAKAKGYKSFRSMLPKILKEVAEKEKVKDCKVPLLKFKNNFAIPAELQDFYMSLSCNHSVSISSIVLRFVLLPEIVKYKESEEAKKK